MDIVKKEDGIKVHSQCVNCHKNIPLVEIKEHSEVCKGGSSGCTQEYLTAFPKKDETSATQSVSTIVLDSDMPGNDFQIASCYPSLDCLARHTRNLCNFR